MEIFPLPRWGVICLYGAGALIAVILLVQHWVHVPLILPWLILLACPLMHIFMHKHHSGHRH